MHGWLRIAIFAPSREMTRGNRNCSLFFLGYMIIKEEVEQLIAEALADPFFSDCFLVDSVWKAKAEKLEIYIDGDQGVTHAKCKKLSKILQHQLDENQLLGEKYSLEVSSPGLDRPIKLKRQYQKNLGRAVVVHLQEGERVEGILSEIEGDIVVISPEGKKNKNPEQRIALQEIQKTFIQVRF